MKNDINLSPVGSSQIHAIGHCPKTNRLAVQFKRKGGPGSIYIYENVTADHFKALQDAGSMGAHFGQTFKADAEAFPCTKCEDEDSDVL